MDNQNFLHFTNRIFRKYGSGFYHCSNRLCSVFGDSEIIPNNHFKKIKKAGAKNQNRY